MNPEEFRAAGYAVIDWIADYREKLESMPVLAAVEPGEVLARFETSPPTEVVDIEQLLAELETAVIPGVTNVQHPMHYGWFPSNACLSSVLGDLVSSGVGALGISWESCPALTEVEQLICDWLRQLIGLPPNWKGSIQDTASTACLVALICAREQATGFSQLGQGLVGNDRPLTVYCSEQAHSSVQKAAVLAGFGAQNLRVVPHDSEYALRVDVLQQMIQDDISSGLCPAAVVATVGTTATNAVDPVAAIAALCSEANIWFHLDAAMAGTALLLDECRSYFEGFESANSLTWNAHKWFGTVLDASLFFVSDPDLLIRAMSVSTPSYLKSTADDIVLQYRDWGIPLGRRFRSLKLLFQLRLDGIEAIRKRIRRDIDNAQWLAARVRASSDWELVAPVPFQTLCVIHRPDGMGDPAELNTHNLSWVESLNSSGKTYLTTAMVDETLVVRISIGVETTERRHVELLWELMKQAAGGSGAAG